MKVSWRHRRASARALYLAGAALGLALQPSTAAAQTVPAQGNTTRDVRAQDTSTVVPPATSGDADQRDDIIVTGTLIKGVATPTGANLLSVNSATIQSTGSTSAIDVLNQTVPQLPTLNTLSVGSAGYGLPVTKIGLRGFGNTSGSASGQTATLVLFNGHRIVPVGILSTDPDPDLVPADVLEDVQILPDGGSATYGSDAIGGVVNFVTRKRFDGVQLRYNHQFGDDYHENSVSVTAGTHWNTGSALVSAVYTAHDAVFGKDRDYITANFTAHGGPDYRSTACGYGTFTVNGTTYSGQTFAPVATPPRCDQTDYISLTPIEKRTNVFAYFEQQLTPTITFSMDGIYGVRTDRVFEDLAAIPVTLTIDASNPYFHPVAGETSQTVTFNLSRGLGKALVTPQRFEQYQIDPSLTWAISDAWQVRADFLYGHSTATLHDREGVNSDAITSTDFNPYDSAQTDAAILTALADRELYTRGVNELTSGQLVANGSLFSLPGGMVKIAVGGEIRRQTLDNATVTGPIGDLSGLQHYNAGRTVKAVFGELFIPVVSEANASPLLRELSIDAAVRYDHYSDFGGTTNPRIGVDYRPTRDLLLRANYQTTFVAPSLADDGNKIDTRLISVALAPQTYLAVIAGAGQNLLPQTGRTFSVGADYTPSFVHGLKLGLTYWNTRVDNLVSLSLGAYGLAGALATPFNLCGLASASGPCTAAYLASLQPTYIRLDNGGTPNIQSVNDLIAPGNALLGLIDARRANFGTEKLDGLDFDASYTAQVPFGTVFAQVAGTYIFNKLVSGTAGGAYQDYLASTVVNGQTPRYNVIGTLGATAGSFTGRVTVRRNGGYHIPVGTAVNQTEVKGYTITDLSLGYTFGEKILFMRDTDLGLTVQNLFDNDPPYYGAQPTANSLSGFANGGTLGRVFSVSLRTRF